MDPAATVESYYEALRSGAPLYPYFAREETTVKFGVGERLTGYGEIEAGLREQTETTDWWTVESDDLVVASRADHAWFSDDVFMAWTDLEDEVRHEFDTRWSGTLERRPDAPWMAEDDGESDVEGEGESDVEGEIHGEPESDGEGEGDGEAPTAWRFVGMHVSTAVHPASGDDRGGRR